MSALEVRSKKRNRVYVRKFDHDEARRRHAAGESITDLAREFGVVWYAVARVVDPAVQRREEVLSDIRDHAICVRCGEQCLAADHPLRRGSAVALCQRCTMVDRRERLRFDGDLLAAVRCANVDCANVERWQPPENFSRGARFRDVREGGIHGSCRACQTRQRRAYRDARKVPCSHGCGTLVLHERRDPGKQPECHPCAMARIRIERAA